MKKLLLLLFIFPALGLQSQKWEKNYDFVDQCICGLSKVGKAGKIGYVDKQGNEIIKLEYADGLAFTEGVAAVKKDTKWMYFDSTGKALTEAIFEDALSFDSGLAVVAKDGLYGFVNHNWEFVIGMQFSGARNFTEGLAPAADTKGLWGYINKKGAWVIKPQYDFTDNFIDKEARVMKGGKMFYINKDNKMLHEWLVKCSTS